MIDASTFAISYNAFWNAYTPTCEHFVRRLNMDGVERFEPPMVKSETSKRRALIAEYAFSLFVERKSVAQDGEGEANTLIEEAAWLATETRLAPYVREGLDLNRNFDDEEHREVDEISNRLMRFFAKKNCLLILRPVFTGCGFIDASEGDVVFGETIYEIKTVERPFRSGDVRQVITYAALNFASGQFQIESVGLFNPRRGLYCDIALDEVCSEISGRPAQELLAIVIDAVSSGEISR